MHILTVIIFIFYFKKLTDAHGPELPSAAPIAFPQLLSPTSWQQQQQQQQQKKKIKQRTAINQMRMKRSATTKGSFNVHPVKCMCIISDMETLYLLVKYSKSVRIKKKKKKDHEPKRWKKRGPAGPFLMGSPVAASHWFIPIQQKRKHKRDTSPAWFSSPCFMSMFHVRFSELSLSFVPSFLSPGSRAPFIGYR